MTYQLSKSHHHQRSLRGEVHCARASAIRPNAAYRQRGSVSSRRSSHFGAPETWHEPDEHTETRYIRQRAGDGFIHPLTVDEVRARVAHLPSEFTRGIEVIQFSQMTRKRQLFPLYGMQWGPNIYLYPIEASLTETYHRPPRPEQLIEAGMFGGNWSRAGNKWTLSWTLEAIRDFYLNNVLIHEIGHVNDQRNTNPVARERYANWFATEYGYRFSRGRV
jgi:hypothetical protein